MSFPPEHHVLEKLRIDMSMKGQILGVFTGTLRARAESSRRRFLFAGLESDPPLGFELLVPSEAAKSLLGWGRGLRLLGWTAPLGPAVWDGEGAFPLHRNILAKDARRILRSGLPTGNRRYL